MSRPDPIRVLVLSVVKHDYVARGVASHPRFELAVVADDANQPDWIHERNEEFAGEYFAGADWQERVWLGIIRAGHGLDIHRHQPEPHPRFRHRPLRAGSRGTR